MLKSFPNLLDGIRLVIIEHDFNTQEDLEYFTKTLHDNHFVNHTKYMKCNKYAPGMGWSDGLSTDPVFVSVWETVTPPDLTEIPTPPTNLGIEKSVIPIIQFVILYYKL